MRQDIIIGIDPDVDQSGVARIDTAERKTWATTLNFPLLIDYVVTVSRDAARKGKTLKVIVEASWQCRKNWHLKRYEKPSVAARKGYDEGRNHDTGQKIVEMLRFHNVNVVEKYPLRKVWKGPDRKITHAEMTAVCGWDKTRSNQEERDAMLIAWESTFPIIIRT